jgi:hypothetical protein
MATRYPLVISGTQIQELQTGDTILGSIANITGGGAGQMPYQTAANTTGFTAAGSAGQYLQSTGTGAPTWATINALPTQTSNSGKYLTTDGTTASWGTVTAGKVLQVVQGTKAGNSYTTSQTFISTGLFATITPTSTSSRIMVIATSSNVYYNSGVGLQIAIYRGTGGNGSGTNIATIGTTNTQLSGWLVGGTISWLDSPASTSALTYTIMNLSTNAGLTGFLGELSGTSSIILMEIAA